MKAGSACLSTSRTGEGRGGAGRGPATASLALFFFLISFHFPRKEKTQLLFFLPTKKIKVNIKSESISNYLYDLVSSDL